MSDVRAFIKSDSTGQSLVLSDEDTRDEMQVSGRWIASVDPVEVRQ